MCGAAPQGSWYSVDLSCFAPGSQVTVTCGDSVDPQGFWNQTFSIDVAGRAGDSTLCYSADGLDHWVTGGGIESNLPGNCLRVDVNSSDRSETYRPESAAAT